MVFSFLTKVMVLFKRKEKMQAHALVFAVFFVSFGILIGYDSFAFRAYPLGIMLQGLGIRM